MTSDSHAQAARHDPVYDELAARPEFAELRHRYRRFVIPATVAFLAWYFAYVLASMFAHDFMSTKLFGNINVALVCGLLQFVTTFVLASVYSPLLQRQPRPVGQPAHRGLPPHPRRAHRRTKGRR